MTSERGDARSISVLLKVRKKGPHPAARSLQEIGLDGVCEFIHASLLERTLILSRSEKNVACISCQCRAGTALLSESECLWVPSRTVALQLAHHQLYVDLLSCNVPYAKFLTNEHARCFLAVSNQKRHCDLVCHLDRKCAQRNCGPGLSSLPFASSVEVASTKNNPVCLKAR